ncbi:MULTISPECIES: PAS domain-containing protein [unclassified Mycobacterium]|uniref:PAS domain-containing protein n=1 Tax=unclassified Mycobacterium TaxID=2642494 RepID=UPI0029C90B05|nr:MULTISPECIES: PAS domain-containing protein [unclassified Mycobacterium]
MTHDWLLVETLGAEPAVVAQGQSTKNLVPISAFLRRNPNLMAIQTAIGETVRAGQPLSSITPKHDRVIRTEVVQMTDGRIHGVHVWIGPPDTEPPDRVIPGPLKWDLTHGIATDTPESLFNIGRDPSAEATHGRAFAEDLPTRALNPSEAQVLSVAIKPEPGRSFCSTWDIVDYQDKPITVGFVARVLLEDDDGGPGELICRAMNWRSVRDESTNVPVDLGQRILNGLAQPGVHRALVNLRTWTLLKWLDDPCPFYDWHASESGEPNVHPDDAAVMASMTTEFEKGAASRVLRLRALDGGWTPIHVTAHRVELDEGTFAGLLSLRLPTDDEVAAAEPPKTRKSRARKDKAAQG